MGQSSTTAALSPPLLDPRSTRVGFASSLLGPGGVLSPHWCRGNVWGKDYLDVPVLVTGLWSSPKGQPEQMLHTGLAWGLLLRICVANP